MTELETVLARTAEVIRKRLSEANVARTDIRIEISGRTDSGELKLEFRIGEYDEAVKGSNLDQCVTEYLRRKGWTAANDYKALPAPSDIPF